MRGTRVRSAHLEPLEPRRHFSIFQTGYPGAAPDGVINYPPLPPTPEPPGLFAEVGGKLFFVADSTLGRELWVSDGTAAGTRIVKDVTPGPVSSEARPIGEVNGRLLFITVTSSGTKSSLWVTDGTEAGTVLLKEDFTTWSSYPLGQTTLLLKGSALWRTDGTPDGTVPVLMPDGSPIPNVLNAAVVGKRVFFQRGYSLYTTDGTNEGTAYVATVEPPNYTHGYKPPFVTGFADVGGGVLAFSVMRITSNAGVSEFRHTVERWTSDGTSAGTRHVLTADAGRAFMSSFNIGSVQQYTGGHFFDARETVDLGKEFIIDDGPVLDLRPGYDSSYPEQLTVAGGAVYFVADDGVHGRELWVSDGTAAGTRMLLDLFPGIDSSFPKDLAPYKDGIVFSATLAKGRSGAFYLPAGASELQEIAVPDAPLTVGAASNQAGRDDIRFIVGFPGTIKNYETLPVSRRSLVAAASAGGFVVYGPDGAERPATVVATHTGITLRIAPAGDSVGPADDGRYRVELRDRVLASPDGVLYQGKPLGAFTLTAGTGLEVVPTITAKLPRRPGAGGKVTAYVTVEDRSAYQSYGGVAITVGARGPGGSYAFIASLALDATKDVPRGTTQTFRLTGKLPPARAPGKYVIQAEIGLSESERDSERNFANNVADGPSFEHVPAGPLHTIKPTIVPPSGPLTHGGGAKIAVRLQNTGTRTFKGTVDLVAHLSFDATQPYAASQLRKFPVRVKLKPGAETTVDVSSHVDRIMEAGPNTVIVDLTAGVPNVNPQSVSADVEVM